MADSPDRISHYRLVARLGHGAMGEVYRAVDERLGRAVALKLLPTARAEDADMQARLLREAQAASALNHPGIVTVHDVGAWHGQVFMVMELVDGERLSDLARAGIPADEALRLVADAADALGAAHARDILHRDVKSDNLMRTRDGRLKVLDFGLAKLQAPPGGAETPAAVDVTTAPFSRVSDSALAATLGTPPSPTADTAMPATESSRTPSTPDSVRTPSALAQALESAARSVGVGSQPSPFLTPSGGGEGRGGSGGLTPSSTLTQAGQLVGTPAYMAPEQTEGGSGDAQSEVFSLGVVLHELLVGRRPFDRPTIAATLEAVRSAPIPPPSQLAPERRIPPAVDAVVTRALQRDRARRFSDMAAFAAALRKARPFTAPRDPVRARRRAWLLAGLIALLGAGGTAVAVVAIRPRPQLAVVHAARRITFDPGCEEYPSFTPDGRTVVFDALADGDYEVNALDLASGVRRRLTRTPGWDYAASVSPDGTKVAYIHMSDGGREARVIPLAGESLPPRTIGPALNVPAWTSDGALLLSSAAGDRVMRWDLTMPLRQTEVAALPPGAALRYVSAYHDGELIGIWQAAHATSQLTLGRLVPGGEPQVIEARLPLDQIGMQVAPSQDGVYYARSGGAANQLIRRPRSGGEPLVVPGGITPSSGFAISADGKRLAYSTCRESMSLARLRLGAAPIDLLGRGNWRDHYMANLGVSRVLFTSDRSGANQVWMLDLASKALRPLTGRDTSNPSASPDGKWLAYSDTAQGGIHVVAIDGGAPRRLTQAPTDLEAQFSWDGSRIVFQRTGIDGARAYVVAVAGGEPRAITPTGSLSPTVSPVENRLIYLKTTDKGKLLMITDLDGKEPRLLFPYLPPADYASPRFSPDGKRLLLVRKATEVIELELDKNPTPKVMWKAGVDGLESVDYAPDGDGVIASVAMWEGDLWLADGEFR